MIEKAMALNKFDEAQELQEMNLKVSGLLDMQGSGTFLTGA